MYNKYLPYQYYRSEKHLNLPKHIIPPLPPHCTPSNSSKPHPKKFNFISLKNNTFSSLNDVECFLNNFCSTLKYIKLINLLK